MKLIASVSILSKTKKTQQELKTEVWGRIPVELYLIIKDLFLQDVKKSYSKRPEVKIRFRIDVFHCISFYFGLH